MQTYAFGTYADNKGPDQSASTQSNQGLYCPLTESLDTIWYINV